MLCSSRLWFKYNEFLGVIWLFSLKILWIFAVCSMGLAMTETAAQ